MKVGTDASLLGAWAPIRGAKRILDIGTGCGIVALMLAQRTVDIESHLSAIDIDQAAAEQALENFLDSPWQNRLPNKSRQIHFSIEQFVETYKHKHNFDLAVCNPPYFSNDYPSPKPARKMARQGDTLTMESLFQNCCALLSESGRLCIVYPFESLQRTVELAEVNGFYPYSRINVMPTPTSNPKRVLLEFGRAKKMGQPVQESNLVIETSRHQYSDQFGQLLSDFYLRYAD